jgi:hypothetical protein
MTLVLKERQDLEGSSERRELGNLEKAREGTE